MSTQFKHYKRIFRRAIQPVLAVLHSRRYKMQDAEWENYVNETMIRILNNPIEFLGNDLPSPSLTKDILEEIHSEFIKEANTLRKIRYGKV